MKQKIEMKDNRLRRTRLYIPGNNPAMIQNAAIYGADSLIFDLEDSIPITEKDSARLLIKNALENLDFGDCEVTVRVNNHNTEFFQKDLETIITPKLDGILLPKTESLDDIKFVDEVLTNLEKTRKIKSKKIKIMPILESALGVLNIEEIVTGPRVTAVGLGGEDLTADIGSKRTKEGKELEYISSKIILACSAYKIQAIDTIYADIQDKDGLFELTKKAIDFGFQGKSVIHPSQIAIVHAAFRPSEDEIEKAKKIVKAYKKSLKKGSGAITVDGKMIDLPILIRSEKILQRAKAGDKNW